MLKVTIISFLMAIFTLFISSCEPYETPAVYENWEMAQGFHEGLTHAREINGMLYAASRTRIYGQASLQGPNAYNSSPRLCPMSSITDCHFQKS